MIVNTQAVSGLFWRNNLETAATALASLEVKAGKLVLPPELEIKTEVPVLDVSVGIGVGDEVKWVDRGVGDRLKDVDETKLELKLLQLSACQLPTNNTDSRDHGRGK